MNDDIVYKRKVSPNERFFRWSPYSAVSIIARIKGTITLENLKNAIRKLKKKHVLLKVRIEQDENNQPWFSSENAGEIPITIMQKQHEDQWIEEVLKSSREPFDFSSRPPIRFILVQGSNISELIILCHHIICDGMSLAYLTRDLLTYLGDPNKDIGKIPDAFPITREIISDDLLMGSFMRWVIGKINSKWSDEKIEFDEKDYDTINNAYWDNYNHKIISLELDVDQTKSLIDKCRKESVTVNSAIAAAFDQAQKAILDETHYNHNVFTAVDLRKHLKKDVGECMGFYAGGYFVKSKLSGKLNFWDNTRKLHKKIKSKFSKKAIFNTIVIFEYLDPSIWESRNFKILGGLVPPTSSQYEKLMQFSKKNDTLSSLLKKSNNDSLSKTLLGTAITNLTNLDFPTQYGSLELDRLIFYPGGGFPLVTVNLVLGVVSLSGKLSLIVEYSEEAINTEKMEKIKDKAMNFLFN